MCGQCDPWCPEDGGPYLEKPHVFLSEEAWSHHATLNGFRLVGGGVQWRRDGAILGYVPLDAERARVDVEGGTLIVDLEDNVLSADGEGTLDLSLVTTMRLFLGGLTSPQRELFV